MKAYTTIADETGTTIEQVRSAIASAEKVRDTFGGTCAKWIVCAVGYADDNASYAHAEGRGETREEAVIDALRKAPQMFN